MFTYFNTYFLQFPALDKIFTGVKNCNITNEYYCYNVFITAETWYCVHSNQGRIERAKIVILQGHNLLRGGGGAFFLFGVFLFVCSEGNSIAFPCSVSKPCGNYHGK